MTTSSNISIKGTVPGIIEGIATIQGKRLDQDTIFNMSTRVFEKLGYKQASTLAQKAVADIETTGFPGIVMQDTHSGIFENMGLTAIDVNENTVIRTIDISSAAYTPLVYKTPAPETDVAFAKAQADLTAHIINLVAPEVQLATANDIPQITSMLIGGLRDKANSYKDSVVATSIYTPGTLAPVVEQTNLVTTNEGTEIISAMNIMLRKVRSTKITISFNTNSTKTAFVMSQGYFDKFINQFDSTGNPLHKSYNMTMPFVPYMKDDLPGLQGFWGETPIYVIEGIPDTFTQNATTKVITATTGGTLGFCVCFKIGSLGVFKNSKLTIDPIVYAPNTVETFTQTIQGKYNFVSKVSFGSMILAPSGIRYHLI